VSSSLYVAMVLSVVLAASMVAVELGLSVAVAAGALGAFAALLLPEFLGDRAQSQAVLPAFLLSPVLGRTMRRHRAEATRFQVVAFALLTPFSFLRSVMNVSLAAVWANLGLLSVFLLVKVACKLAGVDPLARRLAPGPPPPRNRRRATPRPATH
jgi:hypothetical protein